MMRRLIGILAFAVALAASASEPAHSAEPASAHGNDVVVDQAGREVVLPEKVHRVVCLWPETTRLLYVIGAKDLVVAVDDRVKDDLVLQKAWPLLKELPVVGNMSSVSVEGLLALRPDLVIVSSQSKGMADRIAKLGLPVVCFHPQGQWKRYVEEITLVGRCVSRQREASRLREYLEEKMAEVEEVVKPIPQDQRPRVYVTFAYDPLRTTPLDSVQRAGGINLAEGNQDIWHTVDMEWLLARDPDVIVQHALGKYDLSQMGGGWPSLRAVQEGKVYRVFLGYCGMDPAQYLVQVRQMAALFHHPDTVWARDCLADGRAIYKRVYGQSKIYDDLVRELNMTLPYIEGHDAKVEEVTKP